MNFNVPQLAIDLETLAWSETAVITAWSATIFNFDKDKDLTYNEILDKTFYAKLDAKDQIKRFGRTTDKDTMAWWKKQPLEVQEMSIKSKPDDVKVDDMLVQFKDFLLDNKFDFYNSYVWTRGIAYDIPKIESLIKMVADAETLNSYNEKFSGYVKNKDKYLVNTFRARDIRTFNDLIAFETVHDGKWEFPEGRPTEFVEHHAQHDIALDVMKMIHLYNN